MDWPVAAAVAVLALFTGLAFGIAPALSASQIDLAGAIRTGSQRSAGAAILLAAIGVYGLVSYWVSQRTFEIGVRVALGATRRRIVSMILGQGLRVTLTGTVVGVTAALVVTRFISSLLFGVTATDPLTFVAVTGLVLGVAVIAMAFPAWRASRIDPTISLHAD